VRDWETGFLQFVREQRSEVRELLSKEKKLSEQVLAGLKTALEDFNTSFLADVKKESGELVGSAK
jgi:hypothetical protein